MQSEVCGVCVSYFRPQLYDIYAPICQSGDSVDLLQYSRGWHRIIQRYFPSASSRLGSSARRSSFYSPPNFPFDPCVANCMVHR